MFKLISKSLLGKLSPFHLLTVGGVSSFILLHGLKVLAQRSKTVNHGLQTGFQIVEEKLDDLKTKVLPQEKSANETLSS